MLIKHKLLLLYLKYLPSIIAILYLLGSIFTHYGIFAIWLSGICYISFLPLIFMILTSFVFKFCIWHRLPLYYVGTCNILNFIIYSIPDIFTSTFILWVNICLFGIMALLGAYLKNKYNEQIKNTKRMSETDSI